ncbi:CXADR-like membrane protein [Megalobrama amblycephala]|uniref:CXADR-like membrane protein n=1 Tax=Megalobrama amblycephala TaxID=75352 RepID=UPI002013F404|nr:CXADR-like membrane protein [Megalobrama amblycephala]XP_048038786.1 CXADR-like membrane protein [Megalobrama amblycephala]XP_048038787.1 CXADR-like membrane protein [Megalobrama amblycephala]
MKGRFNLILIYYFICVFAVLINKVSLQETVEAVIGGSVVLPCSSTEHDHKLQDIDIHWRHNGSKIVYDIVNGQDSVVLQDQRYKSRAETFPDEHLRGNFSIKLHNLTHDDAGKYICFIKHTSKQKTVQLIIKESTAEKENKSTDQGNEGEEKGADVETSSTSLWVYIVVAVFLVLACSIISASFIIFPFRGRIQSASIPSEEQRTEIEMTNQD